MPFLKTSMIELKESRAFQLRIGEHTLTVLLILFDINGQTMDNTLTLELNAPVMLCQLPATTWNLLWPNVSPPLGWHSINVHEHVISLKPVMAKSIGGGVVAYYSHDARIPVLGRTHITWLNDKPDDPAINKALAITLDSVLMNISPRLPIPMLHTAAEHFVIAPSEHEFFERSMKPSAAAPDYSTKVLRRRAPQYLAGFLGTGVSLAVVMGTVIWFTAQYKIKKVHV